MSKPFTRFSNEPMPSLPERHKAAVKIEPALQTAKRMKKKTISDKKVWTAFNAMRDEFELWRVVGNRGYGCSAVRYPKIDLRQESVPLVSEPYNVEHFESEQQAKDYIAWRSLKVALEAVL